MSINKAMTHFAFSDDSKHEGGRYNSLGLVTASAESIPALSLGIAAILRSSGVESEFKWNKLSSAKYKFTAEKMIDFTLLHIQELRVDIIIWDTTDSRHAGLKGRNDQENLVRMYYHLVADACGKRWPVQGTRWTWHPDVQSSIDWISLEAFLKSKKHRPSADLFGINPRLERIKLLISPEHSHDHGLIQLADLYAGLGAFSWGSYPRFRLWENQQQGGGLFPQAAISFSNAEKARFPLLRDFREKCRARNMRIGLDTTRGLNSYDPSIGINFWPYRPQSNLDRAPSNQIVQ
jgi:hypothetical protein